MMFASEKFIARIGKARKSSRTESIDRQVSTIRDSFLALNRHLPVDMVEELLDHFATALEDGPEDSAFDRCGKLADATDVLHGQYDSENDPLSAQDWAMIAGAVSDYAPELEMEFVTYVMKLAVDHHAV